MQTIFSQFLALQTKELQKRIQACFFFFIIFPVLKKLNRKLFDFSRLRT